MTPEYGAPSQLEKIDMLDLADLTVLNKFDRQGGEDALRDVRKQWKRSRERRDLKDEAVPVFATIARQWNDPGTARLYQALRPVLRENAALAATEAVALSDTPPLIPLDRGRYLAEIAEDVRRWSRDTEALAERASSAHALTRTLEQLGEDVPEPARQLLEERSAATLSELPAELQTQLREWPERRERYTNERQQYAVRDRSIEVENFVTARSLGPGSPGWRCRAATTGAR